MIILIRCECCERPSAGGVGACLKRIRWHYQICLTCANTCHPSPEPSHLTLNYIGRSADKKISVVGYCAAHPHSL